MTQIDYDVYEHLLNNKEAILFEIDTNPRDYVKNHIMEVFKLTIEETLVIMESKDVKFIVDNYFSKNLKETQ